MATVVLEIGSAWVRGGLAGEDFPRFVVPLGSACLTPKYSYSSLSKAEASRMRYLELVNTMFLEHLLVRPKDCRVVVVESVFNSKEERHALLEVLLTHVGVKAVSIQPGLHLALLTTGSDTGIVLDVGHSECRAIAIAHGIPLLQVGNSAVE